MYTVAYYYFYPEIGFFIPSARVIQGDDELTRIENIFKEEKNERKNVVNKTQIRILAEKEGFTTKEEAENYLNNYPIRETVVSFSIQWHFTKLCNQKCVQCYLGAEQFSQMRMDDELSIEEMKIVVDKFYEFCHKIDAAPVFALTGGHPLLSKKLDQILTYIDDEYRKKGDLSNIFIMGNPQLLEENLPMLEKHYIDSYQISLDGTEEMHDTWRGKGSFSSSMKAIEIMKNSDITLRVMATLSKKNADDIIELYKFLCKKGVSSFAYSRLAPNCNERSKNYFDEHFTPEEYRNFLVRMNETIKEMREAGYTTQFVFKDHLWVPFLVEEGLWDINKRYGENINDGLIYDGCHINQDSLCVGTNGNVYACMKTDSYIGNVMESSFEELYTSEEADYFRAYEKYEGCKDCKYKQFCRGCHAVSYGLYGDFYKKDPQCWIPMKDNDKEIMVG